MGSWMCTCGVALSDWHCASCEAAIGEFWGCHERGRFEATSQIVVVQLKAARNAQARLTSAITCRAKEGFGLTASGIRVWKLGLGPHISHVAVAKDGVNFG